MQPGNHSYSKQQPATVSESWAQGKQFLLELSRDNSYLFMLGPASSTVMAGSTGQSARAEDAFLHLFIRKPKTLHEEITTRLLEDVEKPSFFPSSHMAITPRYQRHNCNLALYYNYPLSIAGQRCTFQEHHWCCRWGN